ncbi:F-box only protein 48 [Gadus morhua]|uniref:F-box protein 48 n=1 Tax=Gadus morhua TaxID=8049 RepID=A0A8C4Z2T1_GADMO|nr:F-box only protein 48 [Gadus morhua]XP_030206890.1 F-box only protein 48 [Gadus morhua]
MERRSTCTGDLSLGGKGGLSGQDFSETLPWEVSQSIFARLDPPSLCCATLTCQRWRSLIQGCDLLWRGGCLEVRAVCQREVDRDRGEGLSWKVTLVRSYVVSLVKRDWLEGRYSSVRSAEELLGRRMCPLDVHAWGEILEAELQR